MFAVQSFIDRQKSAFLSLAPQRQHSLRLMARELCERKPHCADHSNFWRGLSARHILAVGR